MKLNEFLKNYKIDYSANRIGLTDISHYEEMLDTKMGQQLRNYLVTYGYIGFKHIELLGINSLQLQNSDLIRVTLRLRQTNPELNSLIAVENQGDGDYFLVDSNDQMYRYILDSRKLTELSIDLESYIANRLIDA